MPAERMMISATGLATSWTDINLSPTIQFQISGWSIRILRKFIFNFHLVAVDVGGVDESHTNLHCMIDKLFRLCCGVPFQHLYDRRQQADKYGDIGIL